MRGTKVAAVAAVFVAGTFAGLTPASAGHPSVFDGHWRSIDTDGSRQRLSVTGAAPANRAVTYEDRRASSACGGDPARLSGHGTIAGDTLTVAGALVCLPGGNPIGGTITIAFEYDAGTDTLVDEFGVVWYRRP